jgi:hypothetical protein
LEAEAMYREHLLFGGSEGRVGPHTTKGVIR